MDRTDIQKFEDATNAAKDIKSLEQEKLNILRDIYKMGKERTKFRRGELSMFLMFLCLSSK
jgi:uncharacterized protein YfkK (UPF0435 family)